MVIVQERGLEDFNWEDDSGNEKKYRKKAQKPVLTIGIFWVRVSNAGVSNLNLASGHSWSTTPSM